MTVTITDAGRERLEKVFPGHIEIVRDLLLDRLSREDIATFARLIGPVREHVRTTPPRSARSRRRK